MPLALLVAWACGAGVAGAQPPVKRAPAAAAETNRGVRIVRVEKVESPPEGRPLLSASGGRYLPKFVRARQESGQTYLIVWWAPHGGLPQGADVHFEYRLVGDPALRRQVSRLTCPVRGEQSTLLNVPAVAAGPPQVDSWRVVVMAGRTVLAERTTPNWRRGG